MRVVFYLLLGLLFFGCRQAEHGQDLPVQEFYYEYSGFDVSAEGKNIKQYLCEAYDTSDFIITKDEQLVRISRKQRIDRDTLDYLHPKVHRILLFKPEDTFEQGNLKMTITAISDSKGRINGFAYTRSEFMNNEGWVQIYDFGTHKLEGVPGNSAQRIEFIIHEVARASYK